MNMFTIDVTEIVVCIVRIALTALFGYITAHVLPKVDAWLDAKVSVVQRKNAAELIASFCKAAEQLYTNNEDKLDYVFRCAAEKGIVIDRAEIEAAVFDLKKPFIEAVKEAVEGQ